MSHAGNTDDCPTYSASVWNATDCTEENCTIHLPLHYGAENCPIQFNPDTCSVTGAVLGLQVEGEYHNIEVTLNANSDSATTNITDDIECENDGTCNSHWDTCLDTYDLFAAAPPTFKFQPADGLVKEFLSFSFLTSILLSHLMPLFLTPVPTIKASPHCGCGDRL